MTAKGSSASPGPFLQPARQGMMSLLSWVVWDSREGSGDGPTETQLMSPACWRVHRGSSSMQGFFLPYLDMLEHLFQSLDMLEHLFQAEGISVYTCLLWAGHVTRRVSLPSCSPGLEVGQSQAEILAPSFHSCLESPQFNSVAQSCLTLCDPKDCSTPGFPVHHQLLELAQTHVHRVGDAIQPSHLLLSPPPAFNLCQHQGLFK